MDMSFIIEGHSGRHLEVDLLDQVEVRADQSRRNTERGLSFSMPINVTTGGAAVIAFIQNDGSSPVAITGGWLASTVDNIMLFQTATGTPGSGTAATLRNRYLKFNTTLDGTYETGNGITGTTQVDEIDRIQFFATDHGQISLSYLKDSPIIISTGRIVTLDVSGTGDVDGTLILELMSGVD
jgi:hypothetical protein